jgi:hypothetical protein
VVQEEEESEVGNPCLRLCIDDLCHGNRDDTLCGGCYCERCDALSPGIANPALPRMMTTMTMIWSCYEAHTDQVS